MDPDGELLGRVREARRRLDEDGPRRARSEGDVERVALPAADGDVLRDLLVAEGARSVIEVGLAYGSSALAIAEALVLVDGGATEHLVIDPYQDRFDDVGWQALVDAGLTGRCTLVRERSQLALPRLVGEGRVVDAAFVDGSHHFHSVVVDLVFLSELVRPGGLVVLDDVAWPSVATALAYFEANLGWVREPIGIPTRLTTVRLPDPSVIPSFEDFVPFGDLPPV